jgi:type VI secretion system protein ImpK
MANNDNPGGGRGRDPTVIRPTPGGCPGGRSAAFTRNQPAVRPAATLGSGPDASVEDFVAHGANPILNAAGPLLSLGVAIGASAYQADIEGLRSRAFEAVKAFEAQATRNRVAPDHVRFARYVICTFVDTAVFQTPWGGHEIWGARSLLVQFEADTRGGEKFFELLEGFCRTPDRFLDLIELQYVCLALGFQGKYRGQPDGAATVAALQDKHYRIIREKRPTLGSVLATHWQGLAEPTPKSWRLVPWWVTAVAAACILLGTLVFLREQLSAAAAEFNSLLASRSGAVINYQAVAPATTPSRLKQLLAQQEQAREVAIDELGPRTVITLTIPELFQSGSAHVAPGHDALFAEIARALERVPGHITIAGHTDDQPVRSLSYDNDKLSELRAMTVADLIKPLLSNPSRIETVGFGSTQPRYQPASLPDNRARNRRVEIQHTAESR